MQGLKDGFDSLPSNYFAMSEVNYLWTIPKFSVTYTTYAICQSLLALVICLKITKEQRQPLMIVLRIVYRFLNATARRLKGGSTPPLALTSQ